VLDANGQSLAYVYGREIKADADIANVLTSRATSPSCQSYSARLSGRFFIRTATRLFNYEKPISRLVPLSLSLDFLWLPAHVSGQLEKFPWLTNQWVSLIRGRLKSFGAIQAAFIVSCSGSLSWPAKRDLLAVTHYKIE
jgi:hypothetical protein